MRKLHDNYVLITDPVMLEEHWPRICGIDFGFDHPTACVWLAHDTEEDVLYVYDCYRQAKASPAVHSAIIKTRPSFIPIAWPHDGNRGDGPLGPVLPDA